MKTKLTTQEKFRQFAKRKEIIIVLIIGGLLFSTCLDTDTTPPKLPTESKKNTLILTSNGCCFWVENVNVSLRDNSGESILLSHNDTIYEHDIFKYDIPNFSENPVQLIVEFRSFYGSEADFCMPVMDFETLNDLKDSGVLLYFQESDDMYLNVIIDNYHASYKMGSSENRWSVMDRPNKVYRD